RGRGLRRRGAAPAQQGGEAGERGQLALVAPRRLDRPFALDGDHPRRAVAASAAAPFPPAAAAPPGLAHLTTRPPGTAAAATARTGTTFTAGTWGPTAAATAA